MLAEGEGPQLEEVVEKGHGEQFAYSGITAAGTTLACPSKPTVRLYYFLKKLSPAITLKNQ